MDNNLFDLTYKDKLVNFDKWDHPVLMAVIDTWNAKNNVSLDGTKSSDFLEISFHNEMWMCIWMGTYKKLNKNENVTLNPGPLDIAHHIITSILEMM